MNQIDAKKIKRNHKIIVIIGNILVFIGIAKFTYEGLRGILW